LGNRLTVNLLLLACASRYIRQNLADSSKTHSERCAERVGVEKFANGEAVGSLHGIEFVVTSHGYDYFVRLPPSRTVVPRFVRTAL
jgi:hypothetical protein